MYVRKKAKKLKFFAILIALSAVVTIAIMQKAPADNEKSKTKPAGKPPVVVEIEQVKTSKLAYDAESSGTLRSAESVVIQPEIDGRVTEIKFQEGQAVKKGVPLVKLDDSLELADYNYANAALANSKVNYQRAEQLLKGGNGTNQARDNALAKFRMDEAAAKLAKAKLDKTLISAPFDGVIGIRKISPGDFVKNGQEIANFEEVNVLKADFALPETLLGKIKEGQKIEVMVDALPEKKFEGKISAIDPKIDETSRNILIRAEVPNPDGNLKPGLFARIRLIMNENDAAITVPEEAVFPVGTDNYVYLMENGKAVKKKVLTGKRLDARVEVVEGLQPEQVVITAGHMKIQDGSDVRVPDAQTN